MVSLEDPTFPIIGASLGYQDCFGYFIKDLLGLSAQAILTMGAPEFAVSRSALKNVHDFCRRCREASIEDMSQTEVVQPSAKKDGSQLTVLSLLGMVEVQRKPYVMILQEPLGDGFLVRCAAARRAEAAENCRRAFLSVRGRLRRLAFEFDSSSSIGSSDSEAESVCSSMRSQGRVPRRVHETTRGHRRDSILAVSDTATPRFAFFRERLQDHCMLSNDGMTASRREMTELQNGCLVFSDRPLQLEAGCFHFALRVDEVTKSFDGLPLLGFTRRVPRDDGGLHPGVSSCLGASVLVGTGGKAYARDKHDHFKMGFKPPPPHEVETWSLPPGEPRPLQSDLSVGDVVGCIYTVEGHIQFWCNEQKILDFDTGRPIQDDADYYAVVDVSFTPGVLTLLPSQIRSRQGSGKQAGCARGSSAARVYDNYMPGSLLTDVRAPLSNIMSMDDLGTIDFNATDVSGASSSMSSLPSVDSDQPEPPEVSSTLEAAAQVQGSLGAQLAEGVSSTQVSDGIAYFWESEVQNWAKVEEDTEQPAAKKSDDMQEDVDRPALEGQKSTAAKLPLPDNDFRAPEEQSAIEAESLELSRMSHRTDCSRDFVDPTHVSFRPGICLVGAVMCTLVIAFLGRSRRFRR